MSNVQIIKTVYDAFGRGDIPAVLGAMAPTIEWYEAEGNPYQPSGAAWVGPDAILQNLFTRIGAEWEYFRVVPRAFHDAGDTVIVEIRYEGKYTPTGRTMDAQACHLFTLRAGKVTKVQQYADTAQLQAVINP
jgi:ketosteroid isomerase-like protein